VEQDTGGGVVLLESNRGCLELSDVRKNLARIYACFTAGSWKTKWKCLATMATLTTMTA